MTDADRAWALLRNTAAAYENILGENLAGFYVHGSLALGCFRWAISDLDFLVVAHRAPNLKEKMDLVQQLMDTLNQAPSKGYEMSVVTMENCARVSHPMPFELHFSSAHLDACRSDFAAYCDKSRGKDPDLAAHVRVTRFRGVALFGPPASEMFAPIERADYLNSIWLDVQDAQNGIGENPVYYALNLCRALAAAEEDLALSKAQGGLWGIERLPDEWMQFPRGALAAYCRDEAFSPEDAALRAFARYMLKRLQAAMRRE